MLSWDQILVLTVFVAWIVWFNNVANTEWAPVPPIKEQHFEQHPTRAAFKSRRITERLYLVPGGCGFIGSWVVRYLLARGERNIVIFDPKELPADISRHGVTHISTPLSVSATVDQEFRKLRDNVLDSTLVVVFNCSVIRAYDLPNFRSDVGVGASEMFYVGLRIFEKEQVIVINIGDTLAHREPIRNWDRVWPTKKMWCQTAEADTTPREAIDPLNSIDADSQEDQQERSFSSYAWHQREVEEMTLGLNSDHPTVVAAAVLRIEGFCSGHLGDGFLSPAVQRERLIVHSANAPITVVNVEDVARASLNLEHMLTDPRTRKDFANNRFTIGSDEVTSLGRIAEYIEQRRTNISVWRIPTVLVFLMTWLMCVLPMPKQIHRDSLLRISPSVLTFARFYTLQIGQLPNPKNAARQREMLQVQNNYSLADTIDGILKEVELVQK